jgi:hypothetical protein
MQSLADRARESDREMNRARTPDEMRDSVHRRRMVRAGMAFDHAMEQFERDNPVRPIRDNFPFRLG